MTDFDKKMLKLIKYHMQCHNDSCQTCNNFLKSIKSAIKDNLPKEKNVLKEDNNSPSYLHFKIGYNQALKDLEHNLGGVGE
jgi:hypothetical protein